MGLFDGTPLERPVLCERCAQDIKTCTCEPLPVVAAEVSPSAQRLRIRYEKRKKGKFVTVVSGFTGNDSQLRRVFTELKNLCGAGGSCAEGSHIEIQGDHRDRIAEHLEQAGYRITKA